MVVKEMRIVAVCGSRKHAGGMERSFTALCEALAERGHKVHVMAQPRSPLLTKLMGSEVQSMEVKKFDALATSARAGKKLGFFLTRRLRNMVRKVDANVVLVYDGNYYELMHKVVEKEDIPLVVVTREEPVHGYKEAKMVVVGSAAGRERVRVTLSPAGGVWVIPETIDRVSPQGGIPSSVKLPVIGALGRMRDQKGFLDLMDAVGLLHERDIPFRLVMGGDMGAGLKEVRARAKKYKLQVGNGKQVEVRSWISDLDDFYGGIDILCVPSRQEAFGYVILEAWAYGVPVLATDAEGPVELIHSGEDGVLVPRSAPEDMANGLAYLLNTEKARLSLAGNGRRRVAESFAPQVVAERWEAALNGFLKGSRPKEMGMDMLEGAWRPSEETVAAASAAAAAMAVPETDMEEAPSGETPAEAPSGETPATGEAPMGESLTPPSDEMPAEAPSDDAPSGDAPAEGWDDNWGDTGDKPTS